jgi:hypothetical protein
LPLFAEILLHPTDVPQCLPNDGIGGPSFLQLDNNKVASIRVLGEDVDSANARGILIRRGSLAVVKEDEPLFTIFVDRQFLLLLVGAFRLVSASIDDLLIPLSRD